MYFFGLFLFIIWSSSAFESRDKGWLGVVCPWVSVAIIITMQHYTTIQPCNTVQHFSRMKRCNTMVWCFCQSTNNGMRHKTWCACTCKTQHTAQLKKNKKHNETVWCQMYQQKTWTLDSNVQMSKHKAKCATQAEMSTYQTDKTQSTTCYHGTTVRPLTRHDATNIDCQKI